MCSLCRRQIVVLEDRRRRPTLGMISAVQSLLSGDMLMGTYIRSQRSQFEHMMHRLDVAPGPIPFPKS
jgi:hypothetical protein